MHELLPVNPGFGLACLPEPSPGDVFFDLEGDPFVGEGGLEYLFGYAYREPDGSLAYNADWALSREAEKSAFERFIDFVIARLEAHPDLHIYHYAPYEPAALKRLMGRYASREEEFDSLLRSNLTESHFPAEARFNPSPFCVGCGSGIGWRRVGARGAR